MKLIEYKELIETRLSIKGTLIIDGNKIVPISVMNRKFIKNHFYDDLFQIHNGKPIFTNRLMSFVGEITDRNVTASHYSLELR